MMQVMTPMLAIALVLSASYIALGTDLLRVSIALFLQEIFLAGIFLIMGMDYLAIAMLFFAVLGPILIMSFASVVMGPLQESFLVNTGSTTSKFFHISGLVLGLGIGGLVAWVLMIESPAIMEQTVINTNTTMAVLGEIFLGEQAIVFELMAVMVLVLVVGSGILLKRGRQP